MRRAARGQGKTVPAWTMFLALAKEWGMPPWRIIEEAPALWVDRWAAVEEARASAEPQTIKPGQRIG